MIQTGAIYRKTANCNKMGQNRPIRCELIVRIKFVIERFQKIFSEPPNHY